jgi:hypothetical protein
MSVLTLHQISTRITSMTDSFDTTLMDMLWVLWAAALVFVSPYHAGFHWRRRYYLRRQRQYHVYERGSRTINRLAASSSHQ